VGVTGSIEKIIGVKSSGDEGDFNDGKTGNISP
jgi:hypothetical protein